MTTNTNAALRNALIEAQAGLEFAAARLPQTTDFVPSHIAALKIVNAALASAAQPASIFALRTDPAKGESPWGGIYSVRADAERDAEAVRKATGRAWEVVPLAEVIDAASPSIAGAAAPHDWRVSPAYGGEICANCGAVKGTRRGNAHCREVAAPTTKAAPQPAVQQGDELPREDFAWLVVQEACETEPADEDDPECIRILRRDLKSAVLSAFLRHDAAHPAAPVAQGDAEVLSMSQALFAQREADALDAARWRFARDSEEDFAICYWDETMGDGGEWMCNGSKGDALDVLDTAMAQAKKGQSHD